MIQRNRTNLVLSIVSLCISLFLVELTFRQFYRPVEPLQLGEIVVWDSPQYATYTPSENRLGFREDELDETILTDGTARILFLGDSFTFGQGVPDGADRFSDIIERRLNTELAGNYHIYNAAKSGTEPHDWLGFLQQLYPIYKPHHIFAVFFLRDGTSICTSLRCYEPVIKGIKAKYTANFFYDYFHLGKFVGNTLVEREFTDYYSAQLIAGYLGSKDDTGQWHEEQQALLEMQAFSQQHGLKLHLIIFPILFSLDENYPYHQVEQEIIRFATAANMPVYSLTTGFMGQTDRTLWVSANDQHPNEKGHAVAAETLFSYVRQVLHPSE